jgi:hypothetical protein
MADPGVMNNSDWIRVPQWIRSSLPKTSAALGYIALASILLEQSMAWRFPLYSLMIRVLFLACLASLYAVAALFFRYGELRSTHEEPS